MIYAVSDIHSKAIKSLCDRRCSENIFERLGLSYTSSCRKEDAIKKVLAGDIYY